MKTYLLAVAIIFCLTLGWVVVQSWARRFAARHPELGPAREEGEGCGLHCTCSLKERLACAREKTH